MLTFVGLGLFDLEDISVKGLDCIRTADTVFLEAYTSRLAGCTVEEMASRYGKEIQILSRHDVEVDPDPLLELAATGRVVLLVGGDPMVSTTHIDLRIRARMRGISTRIIHGSSISTAVCGLTGLQNYRFGKSCSLPFPHGSWFPMTPINVVAENIRQDLHTLVYLDIQDDRFMTIHEAVALLEEMAARSGGLIPLYVGIARAGSDSPVVRAGDARTLLATDFGPPLHIIAIPASLHVMEREYLELFGGL
ncbi:MAG TPA: diphthine synthase [Methanoregulaceae archaeon]|nr:diphthine synthase [Methanoregulaceae archaeon]